MSVAAVVAVAAVDAFAAVAAAVEGIVGQSQQFDGFLCQQHCPSLQLLLLFVSNGAAEINDELTAAITSAVEMNDCCYSWCRRNL